MILDFRAEQDNLELYLTLILYLCGFKEYMSDSFTNYNYVGNTKVSVSIKRNLCQQMYIKRDISN